MNFELNEQDLQIIDMGLQEVKTRLALPVLQKIQQQIDAQRAAESNQSIGEGEPKV